MNMQWSELIKIFTASRPTVIATFVTAFAILIAPSYLSKVVPVLQGNYKLLVIGALLYSGTHIVIWLLKPLWRWLISKVLAVKQWRNEKELSDNDMGFILLLSHQMGQMINLDTMYRPQGTISILEMKQHGKALAKRGLVFVGYGDDSVFGLTERGKHIGALLMAELREDKKAAAEMTNDE